MRHHPADVRDKLKTVPEPWVQPSLTPAWPEFTVRITLPLRTSNPLNGQTGNTRIAGILRASRRRLQRHIVLMAVRARVGDLPPGPPYAVLLTRISAGRLDFDGLTAALKSVRDGVADALHVDDGDDAQAVWSYAQHTGPRKHYAVEIEISSARPTRTGDT